MATKVHDLSRGQLLALLGGDPELRERMAAGELFRAVTPFRYPGRQGMVMISIGPRPEPEAEPEPDPAEIDLDELDPADTARTRAATVPPEPPPADAIRITDCGGLVKYLAEQGMELEVDMVMSRTVFHAVRQWEGGGIAGSQVYLDSTAEKAGEDLWRFLQLVGEVIGLRHSKYKDALVQLERRREADSGVAGWRPT
jgi:hypothetical protein